MKIGIIGSGSIGANAARLFVRAGHEVALCNSHGGQSQLVRMIHQVTRNLTKKSECYLV